MKRNLPVMILIILTGFMAAIYPVSGEDNGTAGKEENRLNVYSPPVIPHKDYEMSCLDCHGEPESGAPQMPHKLMNNCRQCHVYQNKDIPLFRSNQFQRMQEPVK